MKSKGILDRHFDDAQAQENVDDELNSKLRRRKWCSNLTYRWRSFLNRWRSLSVGQRIIWVAMVGLCLYSVYFVLRKIRGLLVTPAPPPLQTLDFLIAGFPKCGTTSILYALQKHPNVIIDDKENCQTARPIQQDDVNLLKLNRYLSDLIEMKLNRPSKTASHKLGIKCPEALKNFKSIHRLSQHSPESKWVIGLRHPIFFIQSFYNYRVLEKHTRPVKPTDIEIPNLHDLWSTKGFDWKGLSKDSARFDLFLGQLGKTGLNVTQMENYLDRDMLAVKPNRFKIFIYTMDQIDDPDLVRKRAFQSNLLKFLDLDPKLLPVDFGHENKNYATGNSGYPETINICAPAYDDIRESLLQQGTEAARWILDEFLVSPDASVANFDHFRDSLMNWSRDPCNDVPKILHFVH